MFDLYTTSRTTSVTSIHSSTLAHVTGGASAGPSDFGRCGPGSSWSFLGDVRTPECATHDAAVRGALSRGESQVMAHAKALPQLPAAIGSYVRARF